MTRKSNSHVPVVAQQTKTMTRDNRTHLFYLTATTMMLTVIIIALSF